MWGKENTAQVENKELHQPQLQNLKTKVTNIGHNLNCHKVNTRLWQCYYKNIKESCAWKSECLFYPPSAKLLCHICCAGMAVHWQLQGKNKLNRLVYALCFWHSIQLGVDSWKWPPGTLAHSHQVSRHVSQPWPLNLQTKTPPYHARPVALEHPSWDISTVAHKVENHFLTSSH